jgi:hypothetical protein
MRRSCSHAPATCPPAYRPRSRHKRASTLLWSERDIGFVVDHVWRKRSRPKTLIVGVSGTRMVLEGVAIPRVL